MVRSDEKGKGRLREMKKRRKREMNLEGGIDKVWILKKTKSLRYRDEKRVREMIPLIGREG